MFYTAFHSQKVQKKETKTFFELLMLYIEKSIKVTHITDVRQNIFVPTPYSTTKNNALIINGQQVLKKIQVFM
jgi:hypothetical protein